MFGNTGTTFGSILCGAISIVTTLTWLVSGIALVVFMWGVVLFIYKSADQKGYKNGVNLMVWGIISLFVIFSLQGIIALMQSSVFSQQDVSRGSMTTSSGFCAGKSGTYTSSGVRDR